MNEPVRISSNEPFYKLFFASAFGAFCLGFGDLLNNQNAATVLKISEIIKQNLYTGLESGGIISLCVLTIIGGVICWVHEPHTRIDAFTRGFSVFALLAVATPYQSNPNNLSHSPVPRGEPIVFSVLGIANAVADQHRITPLAESGEGIRPPAISVTITPTSDMDTIKNALVTLRNKDTGEIIGRERIKDNTIYISQSTGEYLLEIESPGLRRISTELKIDGQTSEFTLPLESSKVPLSIQRLYKTDKVELKK